MKSRLHYFLAHFFYYHRFLNKYVSLHSFGGRADTNEIKYLWRCEKCGYTYTAFPGDSVRCPNCHRVIMYPGWCDDE